MVYVYALCNVYYDSFYLKGLKDTFGTYTFNIDKFPKFSQGTFAVLIQEEDLNVKLIIDSNDSNKIDVEKLIWCDIYGKVNFNNYSILEDYCSKIKPIGPSFAIKIWNLPITIFIFLMNFIRFKKFISNKREFLANYWRQKNRLPLECYTNSHSVEGYVFFVSSIWKNEKLTNLARAAFIKGCKGLEIFFEGGFAPRNDGHNMEFDSLVVAKRYGLKEYIRKIKLSSIVFSTPAVLSCHGWKLGEFLALGKAIITTNHINILPAELKDNVHVIYVDDIKFIEDKIKTVMEDNNLRRMLEINARKYFDTYLAPKNVIKRLLYSN